MMSLLYTSFPHAELLQSCDVNGTNIITLYVHVVSCITNSPEQVPCPIAFLAHCCTCAGFQGSLLVLAAKGLARINIPELCCLQEPDIRELSNLQI